LDDIYISYLVHFTSLLIWNLKPGLDTQATPVHKTGNANITVYDTGILKGDMQ